jgi:probable HAF family extracellular repeat protein
MRNRQSTQRIPPLGAAAITLAALGALVGCGNSAEATPPASVNTLASPSAARGATKPLYRVTALATLGGSYSSANAINDSGQVAGNSTTLGDRVGHAYIQIGGALRDLAAPGSDYGEADALNEAGHVVGISITAGDPCCLHGFLYGASASQDLGRQLIPRGINNKGQVVGTNQGAGTARRAFVLTGGVAQVLGTLGGSSSNGEAINDKGLIVGGSEVKGDAATHAFLFDGRSMRDLGTLGGSISYASAINGQGDVVGYSDLAKSTARHAFIYRDGRMRDLGSPPGSHSIATAVNDEGTVIGYFQLEKQHARRAFVYQGGVMSDLNDLLDSTSAGWVLMEARGINKAGQIVGTGTLNGVQKGFILTPVQTSP